MQNSLLRSRYETQLAAAHRALTRAAILADELRDPGAEEDAVALSLEVGRMLRDSVDGKKRKRRQQSLLDSDRA